MADFYARHVDLSCSNKNIRRGYPALGRTARFSRAQLCRAGQKLFLVKWLQNIPRGFAATVCLSKLRRAPAGEVRDNRRPPEGVPPNHGGTLPSISQRSAAARAILRGFRAAFRSHITACIAVDDFEPDRSGIDPLHRP
jgi:hypothetical protein